ncbi:unnamed protein product [Absidia cylindrospora]
MDHDGLIVPIANFQASKESRIYMFLVITGEQQQQYRWNNLNEENNGTPAIYLTNMEYRECIFDLNQQPQLEQCYQHYVFNYWIPNMSGTLPRKQENVVQLVTKDRCVSLAMVSRGVA